MMHTNMENKMSNCGIFLDFKKAFDPVNDTILRDKLHHYGIRSIVPEWFASHLANRTQTTHIDNDHISSKKNFVTGVPQWVCLRSLTFPDLYQDIYLSTNKLGTNLLYADNDLKTLESVVNNELNNVCH